MIVLGLTGSIGMGKSTIAEMFADCGVPVFDADTEVHRVQRPGGKALAAIEAAFPGVTGGTGLDRTALGAAVFGKPEQLKKLENIVYPLVAAAQADFLRRHRMSRAQMVILDIPLLFERGDWRRVDASVIVTAPARVQRARVLARKGMTEARFSAILSGQMADIDKRARADFIIHTGLGKRHSRASVEALVACLRARGVRYCRQCVKSSSTRKRRVSIPRTATGSARSVRSS